MPSIQIPTTQTIWDLISHFTTELPASAAEADCPICLERIANDSVSRRQSRPVRTRCGHIFHDACLANWSAHASSCPYCRQELFVERFYGVPFRFAEPFWLDQAELEEFGESEIGKEVVSSFTVVEEGVRWAAGKSSTMFSSVVEGVTGR